MSFSFKCRVLTVVAKIVSLDVVMFVSPQRLNTFLLRHYILYLLRPVYTSDFCCDFSGDFCCDFKHDFACKLLAIHHRGIARSLLALEIAAKIASVNGLL